MAALAEGAGEISQGGGVGAENAGGEGEGAGAGLPGCRGGALATAHGGEVEEIAQWRGEEGFDYPREREVFEDEEEAVAFDVVGLEARGAAGREGVAMVDDGGGDVAGGPAGPAGAEAKVGVFAVEEEVVVEAAGGGEHGGAIEGGGAGGEEDLFGGGELGGGGAVAALFAGAVGGDEHAGGVQGVREAVKADLRGRGAGGGVLVEGVDEVGEAIGAGGGIVIDDGDEFGGVMAGSEVDGAAVTEVGAGVENGHAVARVGRGPVGFDLMRSAVIDDHYEEVPEGLELQATQTFPEREAGGESRNDDGDPRQRQTSIVLRYLRF